MRVLTRLYSLCVILAALGAAAACNTIQGVGEDIRSGGEALEEAADGE